MFFNHLGLGKLMRLVVPTCYYWNILFIWKWSSRPMTGWWFIHVVHIYSCLFFIITFGTIDWWYHSPVPACWYFIAMTIVPLNWLTNWFNQYVGEIRFSLIKAPWFLRTSYKSKQPFVLAIGDLPVLSSLPTVIWNFVWRSHTATNARF